jgi:hypothetical protein
MEWIIELLIHFIDMVASGLVHVQRLVPLFTPSHDENLSQLTLIRLATE